MIYHFADGEWRKARFARAAHVFIVGQGPSLNAVDTSRLAGPGRVVIAMNNAYPQVRPDFWIGADGPECFEQRLYSEPFPKVTTCHYRADAFRGGLLRDVPNLFFADVRKGGSMWKFLDDGALAWHRDTFRLALQFAVSLGCRSLAFVGVNLDNRKQDYADGSYLTAKQRRLNQGLHDAQFKCLREFVPAAASRGIVCTSCSPDSRINEIMTFVPAEDLVRVIEAPIPAGRPKLHNAEPLSAAKERFAPVVRRGTAPQRAYLLNNCGDYHAGSAAVTANLRTLAGEIGLELIDFKPGMRPAAGELVLVNGEGTMHDDAPRALELCKQAGEFKAAGCRVALINTVLQDLSADLSGFDQIVTRESMSADFARVNYSGPVSVIPDLAFCTPAEPDNEPATRAGALFLDSVDDQCSTALEVMAGAFDGEYLRLCDWKGSFGELVEMMRAKDLVVSGRFHGIVAAMLAGTPFLALPSNTWKTEGMLRDFGHGGHYHTKAGDVAKAIRARSVAVPDRARVVAVADQWRAFFRAVDATSSTS